MPSERVIDTDVLVIGGGVAGCFAAINAREQNLKVTLVDKAYVGKSGASIMASGWWAAFNADWGMDLAQVLDGINENGSYINNREWSEIMMKESFGTYKNLREWGVEFPAKPEEEKDWFDKEILRSGRRRKIVATQSAHGGQTFAFIPLRHRKTPPVLRRQALKTSVKIVDRVVITELLKQDGALVGAVGFAVESGITYVFKAKATVLAAGNNYFKPAGFHTSSVTGDADAMAYRAGAIITGKEFPDMHFSFAKYSAWKGNGELYPAYMVMTDAEGKMVFPKAMDTAPVLAFDAGRGPIYWNFDLAEPDDVAAMAAYRDKRANPVEFERIGLRFDRGKWQVAGGHAAGGSEEQSSGVWPVNTKCAASIPGLYVAGDCCCTWCWGAIQNGAPWGLMPAAVTGTRAGKGAAEYALQINKLVVDDGNLARLKEMQFAPMQRAGGFDPNWVTQLIEYTMKPYYVLHVKNADRLNAALTFVEFMRDRLVPKLHASDFHELKLAHETKNMVLNAEMILRASLLRTESRGRHFREDFPERDDPAWLAWVKIHEEEGGMKLFKEPVPKAWWPDPLKSDQGLPPDHYTPVTRPGA